MRAIGRAPLTIAREVKADGARECYRIWPAHQRARACTKRPKSAKLDDPVLCDDMARRVLVLRRDPSSPPSEFPSDPTMQISHETIYQSPYVQGAANFAENWSDACARDA